MERSKKVGLLGLIFIILGAMEGGAIYNLPSNVASGASAGAIMLAWLITGIGMFFLAMTFRILSVMRPDLNTGIYAYARDGFGRFAGFEMAWGYWVAGAVSNVGYVVLAMDTLSYFIPQAHLTMKPQMFIGGSIFMWSICFVCLRGIRAASFLNMIANVANYLPLFVFIVIVWIFFSAEHFTLDFWGGTDSKLGSISEQVKSTMLVTLWMFIGIEGAIVLSSKAKKHSDIGTATVAGVSVCLVLCMLVSLLPYGIMPQAQLAELTNPSTAYVLEHLVGTWGATIINIGVMLAIGGSWIAWTMMVAEVPSAAAQDGVFPNVFAKENKYEAPYVSILTTGMAMQIGMVVVLFAEDAWMFILDITGIMILPIYLSCALYLLLLTRPTVSDELVLTQRVLAVISGVVAAGYALWMLAVANPLFLWLSCILWGAGLAVYWRACKEDGTVFLSKKERVAAMVLVGAGIVALVLMSVGMVTIDK